MFFVKKRKKVGTNSTARDSISMPLQLNIKSRPTCFLLVGHFFARLTVAEGNKQAKKTAAGSDGGESEFASS